jgi:hypothetical protein
MVHFVTSSKRLTKVHVTQTQTYPLLQFAPLPINNGSKAIKFLNKDQPT